MLAGALVVELVVTGQNDDTAGTFDEVVGITGRASDSREPRSGVCGAGGPGIAKNDGTLC